MYGEILVPTDGSPEIEDAIAEALDLAASTGGRIHAVSVVDTREYSTLSDAKWLTIERDRTERGESAIADVRKRADERGVPVETELLRGIPHEEILDYADENGIEVVVMGTHGRSGVEHFLNGSVTEKVIRNSTLPILVVRVTA
ncbi:UspA domain protein [Haladaptatus paucihalophilus DX253]|uniref:Nucleotide-binding universal stress protein, UspA family n=1 Tax=Haladaptatus paucihalophilus DX253 TaxID=797209 RepID=E7QTR6_HALPU|nr:universal stress protein [Haladaptatus paucihalophilus]EFW91995.1 UspA domain protein [Haladaptatus paucihalophilus DX253]SHK85235.1 Nucleotide-binding universal stress protein, UspA family [Haladaptatus paucihalophilus DX253]